MEELSHVQDKSVSLIVTSPPYANQRKSTYGGIHPDKYVEWWLTVEPQLKRVLKDDGTLIVNIKEHVDKGQRHTYVLELIVAMKERGWLWTEEWCWHKRNCMPGKWPNRFRDSWERCLQFNLNKKFHMFQDEVKVPIGGWAKKRLKKLSEKDKERQTSVTGSGSGKTVSNWVGKDTVYPSNVLHFATECSNVGHPAAFPRELPEFFIKLFTEEGDVVVDPFMGSGTTGIVCKELERSFIGIELDEDHFHAAAGRISS